MDAIQNTRGIAYTATQFKTVFLSDARNLQIVLQYAFLLYGLLFLNWLEYIDSFLVLIFATLFTQFLFTYFTDKQFISLKSGLISSLSLCLILKSSSYAVLVLAAFLTIASKYIFRYRKKHFFNPSNFGIIATILLTGQAWVSPGQWGTDAVLALLIITGGLGILFKVNRLDAAMTFLLTYAVLNYLRLVVYQGWEPDVFFHTMNNGTLLLFSFFMMTDPKSAPNAWKARVIWAFLIAVLAFVLTAWFYVFSAPLWALFLFSPTTVLFDKYFQSPMFEWSKS